MTREKSILCDGVQRCVVQDYKAYLSAPTLPNMLRMEKNLLDSNLRILLAAEDRVYARYCVRWRGRGAWSLRID